ncbi:hypothetical protein N656DRAFT_778734 [Canariomyces notabilis]|uniref:Uncharacterized protein n=1 Tax=Canariomyces notabilis TaxID=2074819 RepID=A0AAN6TEZ0_9PEZI|nr:hypothetical protein N656DRAFT_778734 [Canariomyces arenarius]
MKARLPMLISVSGCSSPSNLELVSITGRNSNSASFLPALVPVRRRQVASVRFQEPI